MFNVTLIGKETLLVHLDSLPPTVRFVLETRVHELAVALQGHIISQKLHGQVLKQRSGALARSIQEQSPITEGDKVSARVYSSGDVKYGRFWEYGFHGIENVKAHIRTMVFGKSVDPFTVGPYTRKVDQDARPFMRPSLLEMKEQIVKGIQDAVEAGAKQALGKQ